MSNTIILKPTMIEAGQVANHYAARNLFDDYQRRKSRNTLRAQFADLSTFADYLCAAGVDICPTGDDLQNQPDAWQGITWGLVQGFVNWMLGKGLAVTTVNHKLSTVKCYAKLAAQAGIITGGELTLINGVAGFAKKEFNRVDEKRETTRTSGKKEHSTVLRPAQVQDLKTQPATPQGARDRLLMCLLLDLGLRAEEVAELKVTDIDDKVGVLRVYRSKVQKAQTHRLTDDTLNAWKAYKPYALGIGYMLRGSRKGGTLDDTRMSTRAIYNRVRLLGEQLQISDLSPHDCRHSWATRATAKGTDPFALMQAGGWTSMQTVSKYVDESLIANDGVKL